MHRDSGQLLSHRIGAACVAAAVAFMPLQFTHAQDEATEQSYDGLTLVPDSKVGVAYLDEGADLSVYSKILILDCYVAFRKDWAKDHRRTGSLVSVTAHDMERIKQDTANLFRDVFAETLSEDDGYEIVNTPGPDVLLVRPAIIDLDVEAPDTDMGRTRTFTATAGSATLYIELFDSMTGDIIARAADRQTVQSAGGFVSYTNRVTNRTDARRMLSKWAGLLRDKLDELHGE